MTTPDLEDSERGRELARRIEEGPWARARATPAELARLADTESPQGVLAVAARPGWRLDLFDAPTDATLVVFDGVADPGNLGTLLRTAHALGVGWAVALPGTVDPWNPKAVRASAGSIFRLPVSQEPWPEVLDWLRARRIPIFCADPAGEPVRRSAARAGGFALILGSEASGASERVRADADRRVAIRLREGVDSLNVAIAGALLLDRLVGERMGGRGEE